MRNQELYESFKNYFYGRIDMVMYENAVDCLGSILRSKEKLDIFNRKLRDFTRILYSMIKRSKDIITRIEVSFESMKRAGYSVSNNFDKMNILKENKKVYADIFNFMMEFKRETGVSLVEIHDMVKGIDARKAQML